MRKGSAPMTRSQMMSRVRQRDTAPERLLRSVLWRRGLRYRIGARVEGVRPDVVFPTLRLALFVDGCFWHSCPLHGTRPATNSRFWREKLARNAERDIEQANRLRGAGWTVLRLWEHEVFEDAERAADHVIEALGRR